MSDTVTYIACRPGMKSSAEAAFAGLTVEVDDTLTADWEFRERPMTLNELLEAEISKEEKQEADPKNAFTFVVPMVTCADNFDNDFYNCTYLAVRVENKIASGRLSPFDVIQVIKTHKPTTDGGFADMTVNVSATIGSLKAALKKAGFNVLSISESDGVTMLDEA